MKSLLRKVLVSLSLFAVANVSLAAPIMLQGDHFTFTYDDSVQAGLYKGGLLSGSLDTVYFLPTAFVAVTGGAPVTTQAGLQFTLDIDPGYVFAGLAFAENGNYFLSSGGQVGASADLQVVNLDTFASSGLVLTTGALSQTGGGTTWQLSGLVGPQGLGAAQSLQVTLDNTLTSQPVQGIGLIRKSYVGFRVQTREAQAVPEPSGLALMLAGMLAALLIGGRRMTQTTKSAAKTVR